MVSVKQNYPQRYLGFFRFAKNFRVIRIFFFKTLPFFQKSIFLKTDTYVFRYFYIKYKELVFSRFKISALMLLVAKPFEKIVYYATRAKNLTFHVECDVSSTSRRRLLYTSHETKVKFRTFATFHIFHNTDTSRIPFVSVNGDLKKN